MQSSATLPDSRQSTHDGGDLPGERPDRGGISGVRTGGADPAIVDVCLYHGERFALTIRAAELASVADLHVIVEGNITFQGEPKKPTFNEATLGFEGPIFRHKTFNIDSAETPFGRESALRVAAGFWVASQYPNSTIIFSDADEIPRAEDVLLAAQSHTPIRLWSERHFYWTLDWELEGGVFDSAPFVAPAHNLIRGNDAQGLRKGYGISDSDFLTSGWHFSFLGDQAFAEAKYRSFAHDELNRADVLDQIRRAHREGLDASPDRGTELKPVEIDHTWPDFVVQNPMWVRANRLSRMYWR